jgi:hypothetical protein
MGLIIIGTDWDSPPIPHLCDPVISTRPRRPRGDGHVVTWLTEALTWEKALSKSWISIGRICRQHAQAPQSYTGARQRLEPWQVSSNHDACRRPWTHGILVHGPDLLEAVGTDRSLRCQITNVRAHHNHTTTTTLSAQAWPRNVT